MTMTPEQAQEINTAESWFRFSSSAAGKDLERVLSELVDGALKAIKDCADYRESTELVIRYQQRQGVAEAIRSYIASQVQLRDELLEQWKEDDDVNASS